jgi:hypothetical protein
VFGIAPYRARILRRWAAVLLTVGTDMSLTVPVLPHGWDRHAAVPVGLAVIWLGWSLGREQRTPAPLRPVRGLAFQSVQSESSLALVGRRPSLLAQSLESIQEEVEGELELELVVAMGRDDRRPVVGVVMATSAMCGYRPAISRRVAACASASRLGESSNRSQGSAPGGQVNAGRGWSSPEGARTVAGTDE